MALEERFIDEKAAEEAVARAQAEIREALLSGQEVRTAQAVLKKSLAQIKVRRRRYTATVVN